MRQFQIELVAQGASSGTINATITGIQFLYCKTLDQPDNAKRLCSVAYSAGLRISEVVSLKVSDIDSDRMVLNVEQGKGKKDRLAKLSPVLLDCLRDWYQYGQAHNLMLKGG